MHAFGGAFDFGRRVGQLGDRPLAVAIDQSIARLGELPDLGHGGVGVDDGLLGVGNDRLALALARRSPP